MKLRAYDFERLRASVPICVCMIVAWPSEWERNGKRD